MSNTTISQLPVANVITGTSVFPADVANTTYQVSTNKLGNYITNHATTVVATGSITGGNLLTGGQVVAAGNIVASGNITGNYIFGNVSQSTGFPAQYGDSNVASFLSAFGSNSISTTGNITSSGITGGNLYITGPATVLGNLQVLGNTTTINSNSVTTNDLSINCANNAINSSAANGGGIEVGPQGSPYISWLYNSTANTWNSGGGISVAGGVTAANVTVSTPILTTSGGTGLSAAGSSGNLLVSDGSNWISSGLAASGVKLGLGITGETWHSVGRSFNTQYTNSYSYPIAVSASTTCSTGARITGYVNGTQITYWGWQFNGCGAYGGTIMIVPPGATYQLNAGESVSNWVELY